MLGLGLLHSPPPLIGCFWKSWTLPGFVIGDFVNLEPQIFSIGTSPPRSYSALVPSILLELGVLVLPFLHRFDHHLPLLHLSHFWGFPFHHHLQFPHG